MSQIADVKMQERARDRERTRKREKERERLCTVSRESYDLHNLKCLFREFVHLVLEIFVPSCLAYTALHFISWLSFVQSGGGGGEGEGGGQDTFARFVKISIWLQL